MAGIVPGVFPLVIELKYNFKKKDTTPLQPESLKF
jgi:hypothetical protein